MPEPASAFSVRRESKTAVNDGVRQHLGRDAEPPDGQVEHRLRGRRPHDAVDQSRRGAARGGAARGPRRGPPVDRRRERRRAGGLAERVDHVDDRLRVGVDQVERLAVAVGQVGEVVHRLGDVVDRDHVGVAEVDADQRQPAGQVVAHPLHQREEVVGAVDLVHRAGLGVADHDRGPVDPPRHRRLVADDLLGLVLRAVVRRGQVLPLVEHRLVEACRGSHRPRPPTTPGGSGRPGARRRARGRAGCRRRSASRWSRRRRSCRRSRRGGRSGRSCRRACSRSSRRRRRAGPPPGRRSTGTTRSEPQDWMSDSIRSSDDCAAEHEDRAVAVVDELLDEVPADEPRRAGHEVRHGRTATGR